MTKSHFFFRTNMSKERQEQIIAFYNNLNSNEQRMIDDLMSDAVDQFEFDLND